MEVQARRLICPDDNWLTLETHHPPQFPAEPEINPIMELVGRWCTRATVPVPDEIMPVAKHRIMSSMPESTKELPRDDWMRNTMGEDLTFLTKTGSKKDASRFGRFGRTE